ncbi:MAG: DUF2927 domain-containing protein [Pseudomonadota bacterium]
MGRGRVCISALALLCLAACDLPLLSSPQAVTSSVPAEPRPERTAPAPSDASRALSIHYNRVENDLVNRGLLRRDGGGPDVPFTDRMLADNFIQIALFDEYVSRAGVLVAEENVSALRRWTRPVKLRLRFGASIPAEQREMDRRNVVRYVDRLSRVTDHPIELTGGSANFNVLILNEDERRGYGPQLRSLMPGITEADVQLIEDLPRDIFCVVVAFGGGETRGYSRAVAVIRGEHPDLLRLSCLHEEIAQGLGLANDSPAARPSIFNDDEEFGLLTTHDELLLKILYDPRLTVGMTEAEARPIVRTIAQELLSGTG